MAFTIDLHFYNFSRVYLNRIYALLWFVYNFVAFVLTPLRGQMIGKVLAISQISTTLSKPLYLEVKSLASLAKDHDNIDRFIMIVTQELLTDVSVKCSM